MEFSEESDENEYNVRSRNTYAMDLKPSLPYSYDEDMSISDRQIPQEVGKGRHQQKSQVY